MIKIGITNLYCRIGKTLCGCAGAIIGFVAGGPLLVIPGVLTGVLGGGFLEKQFAER